MTLYLAVARVVLTICCRPNHIIITFYPFHAAVAGGQRLSWCEAEEANLAQSLAAEGRRGGERREEGRSEEEERKDSKSL